jgi:hypothetical protein
MIIISRRFCGPPDSANGGYACGLLAKHLHSPARVRLSSPPPLESALTLNITDNAVTLSDGTQLIAHGSASHEIAADVPGGVSFDVATEASVHYRGFSGHPFATCFVCGPERREGDGLRIFPGAVQDREIVAAPWIPDRSVCDSGTVPLEVMWAALDCPSWFGPMEFETGTTMALLGQLSARILRLPHAGEHCVVIGWSRGREGRKVYGGAAVYADGELLGNSEAVWITPKT